MSNKVKNGSSNSDKYIEELQEKVSEYNILLLKAQGALEALIQIKELENGRSKESKTSDGENGADEHRKDEDLSS